MLSRAFFTGGPRGSILSSDRRSARRHFSALFRAEPRCSENLFGPPSLFGAAISGIDLPGIALANDRAIPRWPHARLGRRPEPTERLLYRRSQWRRLEIQRLRPHLVADLRFATDAINRGNRDSPVGSEHHLRR